MPDYIEKERVYIDGNGNTKRVKNGADAQNIDFDDTIAQLNAGNVQAAIETLAAAIGTTTHPLKGKRYLALGDSITDERYDPSRKYTTVIKEQFDCSSYRNLGQSGATMGLRTDISNPNSFTNTGFFFNYQSPSYQNFDFCTLLFGCNDYGFNVPVGTISDTVTTTFYGAYQTVLDYMLTQNPKLRIILMTPFHLVTETANQSGNTLSDYADAVKAIGVKYNLQVIDLYSGSGLNPASTTNKSLFFVDSTHPNAVGHVFASHYILEQLYKL